MEILKNFGFNPILFTAQIINFLIVFYILRRFLFNPTLKLLKDRDAKIAKGLKEAEEAHLTLEKAQSKKTEILKETQAEAEKILEQARTLSENLRAKASEEAKEEAQNIIKEAKIQAQLEFEKMQEQTKTLALNISQEVLRTVIQSILGKEEEEKILSRALKTLKKN